jgi:hypothetical protein
MNYNIISLAEDIESISTILKIKKTEFTENFYKNVNYSKMSFSEIKQLNLEYQLKIKELEDDIYKKYHTSKRLIKNN